MSAAKFITLHIRRRLAGKLHFSYGVAAGDVWAPVTLLTADESLNMHETPGKHAGWRTDVFACRKKNP
jgi:hypothetical protein